MPCKDPRRLVSKRKYDMSDLLRFFVLPSPFDAQAGTLRLLEAADASPGVLRQQLLDGSYGKPFLLENGRTRSLLFSLDYIQSSMRLDAPDALDLAYTQKMMAFLLFHTNVKRLLLLGLGGGSLAKFCLRHLPNLDLTAVEADARVLAFREAFHIPPDSPRFRVVVADAAAYVAETPERFDVILVDAFDAAGFAASVSARSFYQQAYRCLTPKGVLVANLAGERDQRRGHLDFLRDPFGDNILLLPLEDDCNDIAYAFQDARFEPRWKWIGSQAKAMRARYGIDFPQIAVRLERHWRLGLEG